MIFEVLPIGVSHSDWCMVSVDLRRENIGTLMRPLLSCCWILQINLCKFLLHLLRRDMIGREYDIGGLL